jgi:hypothetical protein
MHRLPSRSTVHRFRGAAFLLCSCFVLTFVSIGILIYSIFITDRELTIIGALLGLLTLLTIFFQWLLSSRTRCPLCMTPVLAKNGCSKHRNARTFMGSHRLRVALAILSRGTFTCPYCHERTAVEARQRNRA